MSQPEKIVLTPQLVYGFTSAFLASRFDTPVATPEFHLELWDYMCQDDKRVAIAAPRGHAKSTAVTHSFVLANICFRQAEHIMIVSDTEGQAANFLGDIKVEFIENEELRSVFNVKRLKKDTHTEIIIEFDDGHQVCVIAKGSEQRVRGIKWRNKRPDLIVCDDMENDELVMNDDRREKFRKWFFEALVPCLSASGRIRAVGTILHLDSLLERLMPPLGDPNTITDGLKQYSKEPRLWKSIRYRAHNEDYSKILWVEQFSEARLRDIYEDYHQQGFPEGYSQEYLNYPIDEATAYFKKRDFLPIDEDGQPEQYYIAGDLALSQKDRNAFTVFAVAAVTPDNTLRVREIIRFRGDSLEIIDEIFNLQNRYKPEIFFIEQENIARTLGPILTKEMQERGVFLNIEPMTASQDKIKRARALQARMRAGRVEFDKDTDWFSTLQNEMLQFPRGAYMDQVDALAWIALGIDKFFDTPTHDEMDEMAYNDDYESSYGFEDLGRSSICGY